MGTNSDLEPLSQGRDSETNIWENCSNQRQAKRQRANQNAMFTLWRILQIIVVFSKRSQRIRLQDFARVSSKISMFIPGNSIFFAQIFVMSADVFFLCVCETNGMPCGFRTALRVEHKPTTARVDQQKVIVVFRARLAHRRQAMKPRKGCFHKPVLAPPFPLSKKDEKRRIEKQWEWEGLCQRMSEISRKCEEWCLVEIWKLSSWSFF